MGVGASSSRVVAVTLVAALVASACTGGQDDPVAQPAAPVEQGTEPAPSDDGADADAAAADDPAGPWIDSDRELLEQGATPELLAARFRLAFGDAQGQGIAPDRPRSFSHALQVLDVIDELPAATQEDIRRTIEQVELDTVQFVEFAPGDPGGVDLDELLAAPAQQPLAPPSAHAPDEVREPQDGVVTVLTAGTQDGGPTTLAPQVARPVRDDAADIELLRGIVLAADEEIRRRWGTEVTGYTVAISDALSVMEGEFAFSAGVWDGFFDRWRDGCAIVVGRGVAGFVDEVLLSILFHEVVHCHQRDLGSRPGEPTWSEEGFAMWAGEHRAGGTPIPDGHYVTYLSRAELPLASLAYEATGVWRQLELLGADPWTVYPRIQGLDPAAALAVLDDVTSGDFSRTWGSSRWHVPAWGEAWTGPPSRYRGDRMPLVEPSGAASTADVGAVGFAVKLTSVRATGGEIMRVAASGAWHLRWEAAGLDDRGTAPLYEVYCFVDDCRCPDGSAPPVDLLPAPATTERLVTAAASTPASLVASVDVTVDTLANLCGCEAVLGASQRPGPVDVADARDVIRTSIASPHGVGTGTAAPLETAVPIHGHRTPAGSGAVGPAPPLCDGDPPEPSDEGGGCPAGAYTLDLGYFESTMQRLLGDTEVVATGGSVDADYVDGVFEARVDGLTLVAVLPGGVDLPAEIRLDGVFGGTYELADDVLTFTSSQVDLATTVSVGGVAIGDAIELDCGDVAGGLLAPSDVSCTSAGFTQVPRVEPRIPAVWRSR